MREGVLLGGLVAVKGSATTGVPADTRGVLQEKNEQQEEKRGSAGLL